MAITHMLTSAKHMLTSAKHVLLMLQYDTDGSNGIGPREFAQLLHDVDGCDGVPAAHAATHAARQFYKADLNHDGWLSRDEFLLYFYMELCFKFPVARNGMNPGQLGHPALQSCM